MFGYPCYLQLQMSWRKNVAEYKMNKEEKIKKSIQEYLLVEGQRIGDMLPTLAHMTDLKNK
jgi:hypothetical protein